MRYINMKSLSLNNYLKYSKTQFPMGTRENEFEVQRSCANIGKFHHQFHSFHSPATSSVSYEVQHLFWTFRVAGNDYF